MILLGSPAYAEEGGTWRGLAVLVATSGKTVNVADQENHTLFLQEYDGLVFNDKGETFLDNARYQVVNLTDSGGMADGGYKTFTAEDGSQVFARYRLTNAAPPTLKGEWEFLGGTGKYKGITGQGKYTVQIVSDTVLWDVLEGDYKLP
jgi:hypothetical protein